MQVYLQYKYYITVTKTGDGTPYRSHGYVLLRFRGNVVMKMGTQQQHNNQDRYVNELVPPRKWTLLGSIWCISGKRNESMWPDRVSNPGPLTYESAALPTAQRGPAFRFSCFAFCTIFNFSLFVYRAGCG